MRSFVEIMNEASSIDVFKKSLKQYDWWFSYSDDHSVWKKGNEQSKNISKMFRDLLQTDDKEEAVKAYIATAKRNNDSDTAEHLKKKYS